MPGLWVYARWSAQVFSDSVSCKSRAAHVRTGYPIPRAAASVLVCVCREVGLWRVGVYSAVRWVHTGAGVWL
eukprot:2768868-Prymnesium_polylepis.1